MNQIHVKSLQKRHPWLVQVLSDAFKPPGSSNVYNLPSLWCGIVPYSCCLTQDDCCFSRFQVGRRKEVQRAKYFPAQTIFFFNQKETCLRAPPQQSPPKSRWPELCHLTIPRECEVVGRRESAINAESHQHSHRSGKMSRVRTDVVKGVE